MQTLFNTVKSTSMARLVRKAAPWAALGMVFPSLLLFNALFLSVFPAHLGAGVHQTEPNKNTFQGSLQRALDPNNSLLQTVYIYNSRNPNKLFGNFYYTLGTQLAARGQLIPAEATLSKAVQLLPTDAFTHMNYGIVLEALQRYPEAAAQYLEATRLDPQLVQAFYSLGLLQDKMGNTDLGLQTLQRAAGLAPNNGFINYDLGVLYAKKADYNNSAIYSKKAVENGGDFAEAYNNYGYALAQLGKYDEALKMVDKSLTLKPDSAAALDSKGFALFGMGRYPQALDAYQEALRQDPTIGEIYLHIGQTYEKMQTFDKAVKSYQTYLQMTPEATDKVQVQARIQQLSSGSVVK
jgi:tetratricopeptide (TPR) repeat protein